MVNIKDKDIREKVEAVANVIREYAKHKFTQNLLSSIQPKGWQDIFFFVKTALKYKPEPAGKDVLYEPPEALGKVTVDCEDYTALLGSLLVASGYPVRLKVISNATFHIYPEVGLPPQNPVRWVGLDATTGLVGEVIYPPNYRPYLLGEVIYPSSYRPYLTKQLGQKESEEKVEKTIEISLEDPVNPGDHLRFHYVARKWVPDFIEKWFYEKLTTFKHPYFRVVSVGKKDDEWIVDVIVEKPEEEEKTLGLIITVAIIATALAVGAIATYFSLKKVEKVITETGGTPFSLMSLAFVLFGLAAVAREVKKK